MYFVHIYCLHVYCALVNLDSSSSPCVSPTPRLTSSTQVVTVCVHAYTSTHALTTLTLAPAKIDKYTRQNSNLHPRQNIAPHASNKRQPWTSCERPHFQSPVTHACWCQKTPMIHTHVVERLHSTNKQNVPTRVHMHTPLWVLSQVYTIVSTTPVSVYILVCIGVQNTCLVQFPPTPQHVHMYTRKHAWNDSASATTWGADADTEGSARLLSSMPSTTFSTSNNRILLYPLPETQIPLNSLSSSQKTPEQLTDRNQAQFNCPNTDSDSKYTTLEKLCAVSQWLSPCVVVERLEGRKRCSRALVGERAEDPVHRCIMWLFAKKRRVNAKQPKPTQGLGLGFRQPITPPQQRPTQTNTWYRANPPGPWPAQAASHGGRNAPKQDSHFCHFGAFFCVPRILWCMWCVQAGLTGRSRWR